MRPDARRRRGSPPIPAGQGPVPFDVASDPDAAALEGLEQELALAGAQVRAARIAAGFDGPDPTFATRLRARLVGRYQPTVGLDERTRPPADDRPTPRAVRGSLSVRSLSDLPIQRWMGLAVAAALVVALFGSTVGRSLPAPSGARADVAVGAMVVRAGETVPLAAGMPVQPSDEIRVVIGGRATLVLGASLVRLHGGADIRLDDLSADHVRLQLLAGRSYHRVSLPERGTYSVATGPIAWSARGTAFDLDREPTVDGRERVSLLDLQHEVGLAGPGLQATVGQGRGATMTLEGAGASELVVGPIDPATLHDPWLVANALEDRALGLELGTLDGSVAGPTPTPDGALAPTAAAPTEDPDATPDSEAPTATPEPTARPDGTRAPNPTDRVTPKPTAEPTPEPTPKPDPTPLPALGLGVLSCDGGIVIDWDAYHGRRFNHYATFRNTTSSIPKAFPPQAGATYVDGTYSVDRSKTSSYDAGGDGGTMFYYRTMAFNASDEVIAASPVRSATARPVRDLGTLDVGPADAQMTAFGWNPYEGPGDCFSWYKLAVSETDPTPSVFEGSDFVFVSSDRGLSEAVAELPAGTYHFRLQVVRYTELGSPAKFLVAQTDVATYTVP